MLVLVHLLPLGEEASRSVSPSFSTHEDMLLKYLLLLRFDTFCSFFFLKLLHHLRGQTRGQQLLAQQLLAVWEEDEVRGEWMPFPLTDAAPTRMRTHIYSSIRTHIAV